LKHCNTRLFWSILLPLVAMAKCAVAQSDSMTIVGTWLSLTDAKSKYVFGDENYAKFYYNGELLDTFIYHVTRTSPQCGVDQQDYLEKNPDTSILVLVSTKDNIKNCDLIAFSDSAAYITLYPFERTGAETFERQ